MNHVLLLHIFKCYGGKITLLVTDNMMTGGGDGGDSCHLLGDSVLGTTYSPLLSLVYR